MYAWVGGGGEKCRIMIRKFKSRGKKGNLPLEKDGRLMSKNQNS